MSKRLLLDMDGILVDFNDGIAFHHGINSYTWKVPGTYSIFENMEIPKDKLWKEVDLEFWYTLPRTEDANQIVNCVTKYFDLDHICICTLFPVKHGYPKDKIADCLLGKMNWLEKNYPELTTHFLIGPSKWFCAGPDTILVDDSDTEINAFRKAGGLGILYPRLWNSNYQIKDSLGYLNENLTLLK